MANRTATLYIRIPRTAETRFASPFTSPRVASRLNTQWSMANLNTTKKASITSALVWTAASSRPLVGKVPYVALDKLEEKKRWLRDRERQVVPQTPVNAKTESSRRSIDDAVEQYFKNLHSQGKDPKTIRAYKMAVEEFRKSWTKKFMTKLGNRT
jgi:hypothetical protein